MLVQPGDQTCDGGVDRRLSGRIANPPLHFTKEFVSVWLQMTRSLLAVSAFPDMRGDFLRFGLTDRPGQKCCQFLRSEAGSLRHRRHAEVPFLTAIGNTR